MVMLYSIGRKRKKVNALTQNVSNMDIKVNLSLPTLSSYRRLEISDRVSDRVFRVPKLTRVWMSFSMRSAETALTMS